MPFDINTAKEVTGFDLSTAVPVEDSETILNQENGRVIAAPYGANPEEVIYLDNTQNLGVPKSDYFGYVKAAGEEVWDKISALGRGAAVSATTIATEGIAYPQMVMADAYQEAIKGRERSFAEVALDVINPFAGPEKYMRLKADADRSLSDSQREIEITKANRVADSTKRLLQNHQRWLKNSGLAKTDDMVEQIFFDVGGAATTTLSSIGLGVLTKNPMASIAMMGQIQKNSSYIEAREKGFSPEAARNISAVMGMVEGGLEVIGFDKLMKVVEGDKVLKNLFKYALAEGVQEFSQTAGEETIAQATGLRPVDIPKAAQGALYSAFIGGLAGGGSGTVIEILKSSGLNDEQAELYSERITKVLGDIETRVAQIINDEAVKFNPEDPTVKKVTNILSKFSKGIDIDVRAEINALPDITEAKKEELISQIESGGLKSLVSAATDTLRGRISYLDEQIARIDDEWARLDDEISALEQEGKSTKAKTNRVEKLLNQREALDQQRAEILTAETSGETDKAVRETLNQDVKVKGRALIKLGLKTITGRASAATTALRRARKIYQSDTQEAQRLVLQAIEDSGLPAKSRSKFMKVLTAVTSSEKLTSMRPKQKQAQIDAITHRLQREIEQVQRKEIKNAIDKVLKKMKPKKGGNRPVGKTDDAEMQAIFDRIRAANKLSKDEAQSKLMNNLASGASDIGTIYENKVLALKSGMGGQSIGSMADLLLDLNAMYRGAKTATELRDKQREQRKNELKARVLQQLLKGKDIREIDEQGIWKAIANKINKVRGVGASVQSSWEAFVDIPFGNDMALSKELYDVISEGLHNRRKFIVSYKEKFANIAKEAFGLKSSNALLRKMIMDEKKVNLGKFVLNGEKKAFSWKLSRAEARKIWMELKNENLRETYMMPKTPDNNGRTGNGFTEEMIQALDDFLTPEDKKFVDAQLALYDEMYDPVNNIYAQQNGINLPRGENYSPIIRKHQSELVDVDEFVAGLENRISSANPSLVKTRVDNNNEILPQSDILAMQKYITGAGQYTGMIQAVTELNALFSDGQVAEALRKTWGNTYYNALKSHLEDFTRGSIKRDESYLKIFHALNANVAKALIYGKPNMWAKQMTAFMAYGAEIPAVNFAAGVSDFLVNFRTAIDVLSNTTYMKDRGASIDVDTMKNAYARVLKPSKVGYYKQRFDNLMSLWTKLGDRGAIYMGGWAVYKYNKDVLGKTHEESLRAFEEASKRTQQDINLDQRTRLQANPNPFARMFTLFMSSQSKFLEREVEALRKWSRGQITTRDMAKKIAIYHVVLPVFFQYVANAFDADDDEGSLERAAILGSLNGIFVVGDILTNMAASLYGVNYPERPRGFALALSELSDQVKDVFVKGEIKTEDVLEALGLLAGVPAKALMGQKEGVESIMEGDVEFGVLRALGYTERTAEKALE